MYPGLVITIRKSSERGHFDHGWLETYHTFSFADYSDPAHMGFRDLRVINEDWVEASQGFPTHAHRDMEILTYVLEGELRHDDSMGNGSVIRPGEVQRMSAGTGVRHSEFNPSKTEPVHLLQIWILPARRGLPPSYEQKKHDLEDKKNRLLLVASPEAGESSVLLHQDVRVYALRLERARGIAHSLAAGRHAWVQVAAGAITLDDDKLLGAGDGAAVSDEREIRISGREESEILLFDLR